MGGRNCFYDEKNGKLSKMNIQNLNCLIDLHLHLDGSLPLHTVKELAEQQGITLQMTDGELKKKLSVPAGCRDLNEYLTKF